MPSLWAQAAIVVFWLASTVWFVQREVMEKATGGHVRSARSYSDLHSNRLRQWRASINGQRIGGLTSRVDHHPNGTIRRITTGGLNLKDFVSGWPHRAVMLVRHEVHLKPNGDFEYLDSQFTLNDREFRLGIHFLMKGGELKVQGEGIALLEHGLTIPLQADVAPEALAWPLDQIPNLDLTAHWTSQSAEVTENVAASFAWLSGSLAESTTHHRVTGVEAVFFEGRWHSCYVVESKRGRNTPTKTLVRQSDGVVLSQQLQVADFVVTFELVKLD